jgi:two-component system LytT family response regulator
MEILRTIKSQLQVNGLESKKDSPFLLIDNSSIQPTRKVVLFHNGVHHITDIDDIIMIQSQSNYATFYLTNGCKILTSKTLKHWQETIISSSFLRTHDSFLVNKWHIKQIDFKTHRLTMSLACMAKISRRIHKDIFIF